MAAALLEDVWMHQDSCCHHCGEGNSLLYLGLAGARALDQSEAVAMGGWSWAKPLQVKSAGKRKVRKTMGGKLKPFNTLGL